MADIMVRTVQHARDLIGRIAYDLPGSDRADVARIVSEWFNQTIDRTLDVRMSDLIVDRTGRVSGSIVWYSAHGTDTMHSVQVRTSERSGTLGPAGTVYVTCDCLGGRYAFAREPRGRGCYRMIDTRAMLGLPRI